jgi:nucleoside-diphosphate-sugar epimerase
MKVLLTGATGFVGKALIENLLFESFKVEVLVRQPAEKLPLSVKQVVVGDLTGLTLEDCSSLLKNSFNGVDVVVHAAARVHVMNDDAFDPLAEFRRVNRDATLVLAGLASELGVKRFIFLSSIGVNGNNNKKAFTENDPASPHDLYAISKYEAEQGLLALAKKRHMEVVIIRPPLIYGPNAPGNFGSLFKWIGRPIPLPFGSIHNQRSLIALDNLVSFISLCANRENSPKAANQVFLISDGEDVSTTQLLRKIVKALKGSSSRLHNSLNDNHHAWLVPIPVSIMTFVAKLLGKGAMVNRLFSSLQIDSSKARNLLGWSPVVTMDEQLKKIADAYLIKDDN